MDQLKINKSATTQQLYLYVRKGKKTLHSKYILMCINLTTMKIRIQKNATCICFLDPSMSQFNLAHLRKDL
jgi:hypothetical protein